MPSHINHRCDHDENRRKICALCGRKINRGSRSLEFFHITTDQELSIKKFLNKNFNLQDPRYPTGVCVTCRLILQEHKKNESTHPFKSMPNWEDILLQKSTRSSSALCDSSCNCYICLTAGQRGRPKIEKKLAIGEILDPAIVIHRNYEAHASQASQAPKKGQNKDLKEKNITKKLCRLCFQEVGRGKRHPCVKNRSSKARARENILKLSSTLPVKQKEQICSSLISEKVSRLGIDNGDVQISTISLSTTGRTKSIWLKKPNESPIFSIEKLNTYQVESGASGKQMKNLATFIRSTAGRKSIPAYYTKQASERAKLLENVYYSGIFEFEIEKNPVKQKRPVIWGNAEEILDTVISRRNLIGHYLIKIMADGGQGFFKVCMTIIPEDYLSESMADSNEDHLSAKNRKVEKVTSVHKLIMLATVPAIKETYENMKILFDLTKINDIPFKFVSDLKLLLIVNGQQTATSSFPCPYCFVKLQDLGDRMDIDRVDSPVIDEETGDCPDEQLLASKTYGDLRRDYQEFVSLGSDKKVANRSRSTIHTPLFVEDVNVPILQKCIIPELHILQGFVNHLFWTSLVPLIGKEKALLWPRKLKLVTKNYHGEAFEGNACRTLLKRPDVLLDPEISENLGGSLPLQPFIAAFRAMDKIVHSCFAVRRVHSELSQHIKDLKTALLAINVSETLKIHIALCHIEESLEFLNNDEGFGLWSEQAGESIHREFLKFWNRHKINNIDDPDYLPRLKAAVVDFSSKHI